MNRNKGLTLIELMVVVMIVAILASIAYPSYRNYAIRTNRIEAKTELLQLAQALEKCYTRSHSYAGCVDDEPYGTPSGNYIITANVADDGQTYVLGAQPQGGQSYDTTCGTLAVNDTGEKLERESHHADPANKCW